MSHSSKPTVEVKDGEVHMTVNGVTKSLPLPEQAMKAGPEGVAGVAIDPAMIQTLFQFFMQLLKMFDLLKS